MPNKTDIFLGFITSHVWIDQKPCVCCKIVWANVCANQQFTLHTHDFLQHDKFILFVLILTYKSFFYCDLFLFFVRNRLMDFFPAKKQTEEYLRSVFIERDLAEVVKLHKAQASYEAKRELQQVRLK